LYFVFVQPFLSFRAWEHAKNRAFFHVGGYEAPYYFNPVTDFESVHAVFVEESTNYDVHSRLLTLREELLQ